jgi:hypothetical protein
MTALLVFHAVIIMRSRYLTRASSPKKTQGREPGISSGPGPRFYQLKSIERPPQLLAVALASAAVVVVVGAGVAAGAFPVP